MERDIMENNFTLSFKLIESSFADASRFPPCFSCRKCMRTMDKSEIDEAGAIMTLRCTVFHDSPAFTAKFHRAIPGFPNDFETRVTISPAKPASKCSMYEGED